MARQGTKRAEHLEWHGAQYRVTVAVPKILHSRLGTRIKRPLHTDSLAEANRRKWPVVAELRAIISAERDKVENGEDASDHAYARSLHREIQRASSADQRFRLQEQVDTYIDKLSGPPVREEYDPLEDEFVAIYDPERERRALAFSHLAKGKAVPFDEDHGKYLAQLTVKPRTRADDERAIAYLLQWCRRENVRPHLDAITERICGRFMDDLPALAGNVSPVTANKYLRRLSGYWKWLKRRGIVNANVWQEKTLKEPTAKHDERERPFTDAEMKLLLEGPGTQHMHDLMRIAALTGSRIDPIVCLRVGDCRDGAFVFKAQKKESGPRACPIHPELQEIVARRSEGRSGEDPLFPEWPAPAKSTSMRERSFKASNQFTEYRRKVKVDDRVEGARRARTNFHSFRRWFVTKAEQADQPESIIASVVGHKRQGITLGVYSHGPLMDQMRRCVEAVQLPEGKPSPAAKKQC